MTIAAALLLAWCLDLAFGEPRNAWHPVAWLGRALSPVGRWLLALPEKTAFRWGAIVWCGSAVLLWLCAAALQSWMLSWPVWLAIPALALALKPTFAWRMLHDEVESVLIALGDEGVAPDDPQARAEWDAAGRRRLESARLRVARLCSRDVSVMDASQLRETAIETLAENLNDSLVAPMFWAVLFGLPGAVVYRFANTADAMWGYRGRWEWAGKWAAIADDVLSWVPARLTALALARWQDWRHLAEIARVTPSPNGGWPMGAMAMRLNVRLRKPGVYVLNPDAPSPGASHHAQALRIAHRTAWGVALVATLLSWWRLSA